ncbi:MAG: hypothetical protein WKF34_01610 [Pyrinomonadaceae bacterium]
MARKLRIEIEDGLYHVIARGNGRQAIFHDDEKRKNGVRPATLRYFGHLG